ncbi:MAG: CheR family methyltransferase [Halochromatium sp.]|uniref:CheR family methyltransferase n=1 Tax=Halochromatium sp. TaxID=2049430 RepID=UPI00397B3F2C
MEKEPGLQAVDHQRVAAFIERIAGIQLPEHKRSLIETRLRRRVKATGYPSIQSYLDFAFSPAGEATEQVLMLDALTTNKTDFFREPTHFDYLIHYVNSRLLPLKAAGWASPLRVWCAASSTGEEPYTLAMVLCELERRLTGFRFELLATDIAPSVLATAKKAIYDRQRIASVPETLRKRYFLRSKDARNPLVRIAPELRQRVVFDQFNLISGHYAEWPIFDVIFCRNVMIYFSAEDRNRVVKQLATRLNLGGLLFIGHSETLGVRSSLFKQQIPTVYRLVEDARR